MNAHNLAKQFVPRLLNDPLFVVIGKPAGLVLSATGAGSRTATDLIRTLFGLEKLHLVMPIESQLSGPVILAKSAAAAARLESALKGPRTRFDYTAVVEGKPTRRKANPKTPNRPAARELQPRVIRQRGNRSLIEFRHDGPRTAGIRADLKSMGLTAVGDSKPSRHRVARRRPGRIYVHRTLLQFQHPETGKTVAVRQPAPPAFDASLAAKQPPDDLLSVALAARLPVMARTDTDSFRLIGGKYDGLPGLTAEKFGSIGIIQTMQGKMQGNLDFVRQVGKWYGRTLGLKAVYHKTFVRDRSRAEQLDDALHDPRPLVGKPAPREFEIRENGIAFLVRPYDGYSTGLFLDQRENRQRLRDLASGQKVLNGFAYTCGFSVACALGGATETVSVDISRRFLEWGKCNFQANSIDPDGHHFICEDIFDYLARSKRRERQFDLIILDPPSFARTKKPRRVFSIIDDLERLIAAGLGVLAPGGHLIVSTNNRTRSAIWLREQLDSACAKADRKARIVAIPALPLDHRSDPDYAKSILARIR